jgi:hypothetical protein
LDLDHVECLLPEEGSAKCEISCYKLAKCKKVVFSIPYKILDHYNCTECPKVTKMAQVIGQ